MHKENKVYAYSEIRFSNTTEGSTAPTTIYIMDKPQKHFAM